MLSQVLLRATTLLRRASGRLSELADAIQDVRARVDPSAWSTAQEREVLAGATAAASMTREAREMLADAPRPARAPAAEEPLEGSAEARARAGLR